MTSLFAEPVKATVDNDKAQERLDLILADGAHSTFTTAAEIGAALGGTFLRVVWDETVTDHPFIDSVDADYAAPEFKWSRLQAITFYFIVETRGQVMLRHAERHELDANGQGVDLPWTVRGHGFRAGPSGTTDGSSRH